MALFDDNLEAIGQYTQGKIVKMGETAGFVVGTHNGFLNLYGLNEKPNPSGGIQKLTDAFTKVIEWMGLH